MLKGIDISHWQQAVNWNKIKADFIIHKVTQGTIYLDPTYKERKDKISGTYHFAGDFNKVAGDPVKEAEWYLKNTDHNKMLVLDWEIEHSSPVEWCRKFISVVESSTGKDCWFYTNDARALKYKWPENWKFWIARYKDYSGTLDWDYQPKHKWDIWQYTSRGKLDGIEGNVDLNIAKTPLENEEAIPPIPEPQTPASGACSTYSDEIATLKEKISNQTKMIVELNKKIETLKQERDKYKEQAGRGTKALTIIEKIKLIFGG